MLPDPQGRDQVPSSEADDGLRMNAKVDEYREKGDTSGTLSQGCESLLIQSGERLESYLTSRLVGARFLLLEDRSERYESATFERNLASACCRAKAH